MTNDWKLRQSHRKRPFMYNAFWIKNTHMLEKDDYECSACGYPVLKQL